MNPQDNQTLETCPACNVSITADEKVNFAVGQPGTRAKLYARVCQFNQKPGCINQQPELIGEKTEDDDFRSAEDLIIPGIHDT
ncbi:hypothetical protein C1752_01946 [Acaryochloris thomasi RCC1774]|uniref:Uncharacterized protein n=1 Tax=Acaryochloris thomasi RCC1774 TaxID=1764569 RepID=A0A2W1JJS3_9CYAN|nr:hypothetical protein [Acaryochloris thomasi]PZD73668.1 hypothetical protein C1752_01946 [Acaryochloris thomasi RCC1774]